jgi:hypothetical protein
MNLKTLGLFFKDEEITASELYILFIMASNTQISEAFNLVYLYEAHISAYISFFPIP